MAFSAFPKISFNLNAANFNISCSFVSECCLQYSLLLNNKPIGGVLFLYDNIKKGAFKKPGTQPCNKTKILATL